MNKQSYTPLKESVALKDQAWPEGTIPLAHTLTMAFNHENYIAECIDSILMQKTTFPVHVLIHDDASSDKTSKIIKEYERRYPQVIKAYHQKENTYSQVDFRRKHEMREAFYSWRIGKYEARCEGDDYWLDPLKLQKQVDFLEANPEYSLCVGNLKGLIDSTKELYDVDISHLKRGNNPLGFTFELEDVKTAWFTKTLTSVYRYSNTITDKTQKYKYGRDTNTVYHYLKEGQKGFFFYDVLGVYRRHQGGVVSMQPLHKNLNGGFNTYLEMYQMNKDEFCRYKLFYSTLNLLRYNIYNKYVGNTLRNNIILFLKAVRLAKKKTEYIKTLKSLLPKPTKRD